MLVLIAFNLDHLTKSRSFKHGINRAWEKTTQTAHVFIWTTALSASGGLANLSTSSIRQKDSVISMCIPPLTPEQLKQLTAGPPDVEWRYEMRRESQQIIPGLYLGPFQVSKDLNQLLSLGITHIVCMRDAKEAFSVKPRFPAHFKYMVLDVEDTEDQNLIRLFPNAKRFIYSAIESGGRILVHCNGGISLSPAFVVMFVMEHFKLNFEEAMHLVQSRRYCISPNGGFMTQIKEYESIYRATQTVASFGPSRGEQNRRKRDEEDDDDEAQRAEERKRAYLSEQDSPMPLESPHSPMDF